jgi:hypothetical protein
LHLLNTNKNEALTELSERMLEERELLISQITSANETIETQTEEISLLNQQVSNLSSELNTVDTKIEDTKALLNDFESDLQESTNWFKENSNIGNFFEYRSLSSQVKKCSRINGDECHIKLVCLDLIHEKYKEFTYAYDDYTSHQTDKLQSLAEFYENERGDCEDFSLLVKAEINYLKDNCRDGGADGFLFETAVINPGSLYYVDFKEEWMINHASSFMIPQTHENVYVVCGNYPATADPNQIAASGVFGHCALGFTDKTIDSSSDVYTALVNSIIVEPQTGFLTFDQREKNLFPVPEKGNDVSSWKHFVWAVITDEDYYLYDRENFLWRGYDDFLPILDSLRAELETLE